MTKFSSKKPVQAGWIVAIIGAICTFTYAWPRFLVNAFGLDSPWTSYLYMYGFGFVTFAIGIALILRKGSCQFGRGSDTFWFKVLIFGFVFFASLHGIWIILSLTIPYKGA